MSDALFEQPPDFDQPIAVLKHCHNKIRKQLRMMEKLSTHLLEFGANLDAKQGANAILRYFDEAAPKHHADEEEDLMPMLQSTAIGEDAAHLSELLPAIMQEHRQMEVLWQILAPQLLDISNGNCADLSKDALQQFVKLYCSHMETEEAEIAPLANKIFSTAQMAQLGQAMRSRRNIER